jgi:hypothetical protein
MSSDCYFFYDNDLPSKQKFIQAMCLECFAKDTPRASITAWKWSAKNGYGEKTIKCSACGTTIHQGKEGNAEDQNTPAL